VTFFSRSFLHSFLWIGLLVISLTACSPSNDADSVNKGNVSGQQTNKTQADYFLESLKLVEQSGRQLQSADRTKASVEQALSGIDAGMALAFNVDATFLNGFDVRLGKNYQRYFIDGVQTYRLGIEAADLDEQKKGLALLNRWAQFWSSNQAGILPKLQLHIPS
jgi:hypothetical protein